MTSGKVLISHVREDREAAERLSTDLKDLGAEPCLGEDSFLHSQHWSAEIRKAMENSPYLIVLVSNHSVLNRNYPQREFVTAIEVLAGISATETSVILARLDDCETPYEKPHYLHRVDLFPTWQAGLNRILQLITGDLRRGSAHREDNLEISKRQQQSDNPTTAPGTVFRDTLRNGSKGPAMVVIPAGQFEMGDIWGDGLASEKPVHTVHILRSFALGRYPITFDKYALFTVDTGRELPFDNEWGRGSRPVIIVSSNDAAAYADWLSEQTGKTYRLPTEAEWEYGARSGGKEEKWSGTSLKEELDDYAWHKENSRSTSQPVGEKKPNALGLYDMSGNVWEWVQDPWHDNYEGAPDDGSAWKTDDDGLIVIRGGSWYTVPWNMRTVSRLKSLPSALGSDIGFRLVREL